MKVALIWAMAENGAIGVGGDLPWRLPRDLRHFKETTRGHTIVMGRKTWESLPGALPKRRNLVVTRRADYTAAGAEVFGSVDAALDAANDDGTVFVVGGAEVYAAALPRAEELFVTRVHADVAGDVFFPAVDWSAWRAVDREHVEPDDDNEFAMTFERYVRT